MNILIIGKYPPIQGGVSSQTYWLAKGLGEKGHRVYVVSNCWEVEQTFREDLKDDDLSLLEPKNVHLFSTTPGFRSAIPYSRSYESRLMSMALDVIQEHDIQIIYSHYLLPYGVAALMAKKITGIPWVVQHAGSDIGRLIFHSQLKSIFLECFRNADRTIGYANTRQRFIENGLSLGPIVNVRRAIDISTFHPSAAPFDFSPYGIPKGSSIFTYFGKISRLKKTDEFLEAAAAIKEEDFSLVFVTESGKNLEELKKKAQVLGMGEKCVFLPFQPPWKIPGIMKASTCIVCPESDEEPYLPKGTHGPQIAREAMAVGKPVIIGRGVKEKGYYTLTKENEDILVVDPMNRKEFAEKLRYVMGHGEEMDALGKNARKLSEKQEDFEGYVSSMEGLFSSLAR